MKIKKALTPCLLLFAVCILWPTAGLSQDPATLDRFLEKYSAPHLASSYSTEGFEELNIPTQAAFAQAKESVLWIETPKGVLRYRYSGPFLGEGKASIQDFDSAGSAVVVGNTLLVTASHPLNYSTYFDDKKPLPVGASFSLGVHQGEKFRLGRGRNFNATVQVVIDDPWLDFTLLKIVTGPDIVSSSATIEEPSPESSNSDAVVFQVGFPGYSEWKTLVPSEEHKRGQKVRVAKFGRLVDQDQLNNCLGCQRIQADAGISALIPGAYGYSGGGLFDNLGNLIGIATMRHDFESEAYENEEDQVRHQTYVSLALVDEIYGLRSLLEKLDSGREVQADLLLAHLEALPDPDFSDFTQITGKTLELLQGRRASFINQVRESKKPK